MVLMFYIYQQVKFMQKNGVQNSTHHNDKDLVQSDLPNPPLVDPPK